jgi:hypothetical protein
MNEVEIAIEKIERAEDGGKHPSEAILSQSF